MSKDNEKVRTLVPEEDIVAAEVQPQEVQKYNQDLMDDYANWVADESWQQEIGNQTVLGDIFVVEFYVYWPKTTTKIIGAETLGSNSPVLTSHARVLAVGNDVKESHKGITPGTIVKCPDWLAIGSIRNFDYDLANSLDKQRGVGLEMQNRPESAYAPAISKLKQNIYIPDALKNEITRADAHTFRLGSEYIISVVNG